MNRDLTNRIGHWLDCLFGYYADKIKIIANVIVHDWRMSVPIFFDSSLSKVTEDEIKNTFSSLDKESVEIISKYISAQTIILLQDQYQRFCFYNYEKLFRKEEKRCRLKLSKTCLKLQKKYSFQNVGPESLLFHHGLLFFPEAAIDYLAGGKFIDAGACYGDSTLIFSRFYKTDRIYAFEPSPKNREIMKTLSGRFHIPENGFEMIPYGLGEKRKKLVFCEQESPSFGIQNGGNGGVPVEILSLDQYLEEHGLSGIRLIKADLEGMGLAMLKGAEQSIRKNRPILTLSIYHNREELFEIYKTLRSWNLNYEFAIRSTAFPLAFSEITLLGYPAELNSFEGKWKTDEAMFKNLFEFAEILLKN